MRVLLAVVVALTLADSRSDPAEAVDKDAEAHIRSVIRDRTVYKEFGKWTLAAESPESALQNKYISWLALNNVRGAQAEPDRASSR